MMMSFTVDMTKRPESWFYAARKLAVVRVHDTDACAHDFEAGRLRSDALEARTGGNKEFWDYIIERADEALEMAGQKNDKD